MGCSGQTRIVKILSHARLCTPIIPTLARQRQKYLSSLESSRSVSLDYVRFCLEKGRKKIEAKDGGSVVKAATALADWVGHDLL